MLKKDTNKEAEWDLVIAPGRAEKNYWKDLWHYRELFYILRVIALGAEKITGRTS